MNIYYYYTKYTIISVFRFKKNIQIYQKRINNFFLWVADVYRR